MTPDGADLLVSSGCLVHSACPVAKAKIQDAALNPVERRVQPAGLLFTKLTVVGGTALVEPGPPSALTHSSRPLVITPLRI